MGAVFEYRVRDQRGKIIKGTIEAENKQLVMSKLREQGFVITSLKEQVQGKDVREVFADWFGTSTKDLVLFSKQFSTLINAGMPILKCLDILVKQTENKRLSDTIFDLKREVEGGATLAGAMSKYPKVFPELFVTMVNAGEVGGVLDKTLERMAEHYEKEYELKEKVKTATRYPMVVGFFAIAIVVLLLSTIVPTFAKMYKDMGLELPFSTRILLGISNVLTSYLPVVIILLAATGYALYKYTREGEGRAQLEQVKEKMPVFGELNNKIRIARICRTLGTLISSGVPLLQALEVVKAIAGTLKMTSALESARSHITEGAGMAGTLEGRGLFPPMVTQMIAVGEETGAVDDMLNTVADFYDKEVKNTTERLGSLIEPILIVFLGIVVGGIIVATILPVFSLYAKIGAR